jgi:hypothetical protein
MPVLQLLSEIAERLVITGLEDVLHFRLAGDSHDDDPFCDVF